MYLLFINHVFAESDGKITAAEICETQTISKDENFDNYFFDCQNYVQAVRVYAHATRNEFLQSIFDEDQSRQKADIFHRVNSFMAISNSWDTVDDILIHLSPKPNPDTSLRPQINHDHLSASDVNPSSRMLRFSCKTNFFSNERNGVNKKMLEKVRRCKNEIKTKQMSPIESRVDQVLEARKCPAKNPAAESIFLKSIKPKKILFPNFNDPPKNALVLFWGQIRMTLKELEHLNLFRCIKILLEEDHYRFVLLKMQYKKFILQCCDSDNAKYSSDLDDSNESKPVITRRRKSISEFLFKTKKNEGCHIIGRKRQVEKKITGNSLLSCIGHSSDFPKSHKQLRHNDSLCLKSCEIIRKKAIWEFVYQRVIYCGTQENGIPNNMLVWVYHSEYGSYTTAECFCVECDDQSHAKHLSRALRLKLIG